MTGVEAMADTLPLYTAVLCAGAAAWLTGGREHELRRARLMFTGGGAAPVEGARTDTRQPAVRLAGLTAAARERWRARSSGRLGPEVLCLPAGCLLALWGASLLPLLGATAAVPAVGRWRRARERRRERERRAAEVIELCGAVTGELRAGRQPGEALLAVSADGLGRHWPLVRAAARFGGDVPRELRRAARAPGAEGLIGIAACWQVAVDGGAGLAAGLDRVGVALRAERDRREHLRAQLASQRTTSAILALLPVVALLLGSGMGADPLRVLLHTPAGLACLLTGGLLEWAGVALTARVLRAAAVPETTEASR
ncbi:hypothetical protein LRS74_15055 [Streptomyces sp. LX-29]|uniref:type II secretion system F family protein n=1 Tax=Streptomyces sp. LX-29 TaxID=2900152 RepID=UPI00240D2AE2|nr:hypothetical protein [Streptomyces sp. LX-29]WFB08225.1 hypothetical protein LRS74_15055 [Streptomyces sp. LX-29]